ncbi:MAG: transcriptional regulator [Solibacillus sp.]
MFAKELEEVKVELEEVIIEIPDELVIQFERTLGHNIISDGMITYLSTRKYVEHMQPNQLREALKKGYVEMSHINLSICGECSHAEYEAEHMVERLVSGG